MGDINVLLDRTPAHQLWHGATVTRDWFMQRAMQAMSIELPVDPVRTLLSDPQFILPAPVASQLRAVDAWDLGCDVGKDPFAGLDIVHRKITDYV